MSLAISAARGGGITLSAQLVKLAIQFASIVILSRLLTPDAFGLIAMVAVFVALGELLRDFGTSIVGLQRPQLSKQQASNLFWLATALGAGTALLLAVCAPLLVAFYDEPRLNAIVPALACAIVLNAMAAQFQVQLARKMWFTRLAIADVGAMSIGLAAAVLAAVNGLDYWALVIQLLVVSGSGLILRWYFSRWRPTWPRRLAANSELVRDSAAFGLAQFLTYVSQNLDAAMIGARWDAASLGAYSRAFQLLTAPLNSLMGPLTQVVIPTANRAARAGRSTDSVFLRLQSVLGMAIVGVYAITAAVAEWLVPLALGSQWQAAVPLFQILALGGSVWIFSRVSYWNFVIRNLGRELLAYNIVSKSLASLLIFWASFISIEAVAWAVSIGLVLSWPLNLYWLHKSAAVVSLPYFTNGLRILLAGTLAFVTSAAVFNLGEDSDLKWGIAAMCAGGACYVGVLALSRQARVEIVWATRTLVSATRRRKGPERP